MSSQTRRTFLKHSLAAAGAGTLFTVAGTKASGRILGANDTVRLGVAGIHGRGGSHIDAFAGMKGVDVTYLIDPDSRLFPGKTGQVKSRGGNTPKCVQDIREALEDKDLDAVSVATCNHWHALITFWACQAGKDVYVEKPCSHNVFEGRQCVKAARKNKCIVQHGTQSRSSGGWAKAAAVIASGKYGKLLVSKAYASKPRWSIGFKDTKEPPKELDFNLWLGPAPMQPYHENKVHYNWHWFWDTGSGEIGNQGVHQMDIARWGIPGGTLPVSAFSMGGRWVNSSEGHPPFTDQAETPNMQLSVLDFGETLLVFEVAGLCGKSVVGGKSPPRKVDNEFYLEAGAIKGGKFYPKDGNGKSESLPDVDYHVEPGSIFSNFIDCVRHRDHTKLQADIETAHYSAALCHLANASYRMGKQVPGSTQPEILGKHSEVARSWSDIKDALKNAVGLDVEKSTYQLGPTLKFDPKSEQFVGNSAANALITRKYRKPFEVTENV
ncbi:MAG: Gfo/Idh/MocA family oxidoreductase [Planctomycetes bacterium]|nr:Gfo/Idh/MocA family oxidoreductase [Planctomycetota bacterium]